MVKTKQSLKANAPLFFLVGEDDYLKQSQVDELKRENPDQVNHDVFDGRECSAGEVISACSTFPFGPGIRVVVVKHAEGFPEGDRELLLEYVANPSPTACLLLLFDKLDKRSRLFREAQKSGWIRNCSSLSGDRLLRWLQEKARDDCGKDLPEDAARSLIDLAGTDMNTLANEIEKLSLYVGKRRSVRPDDVEEIVVSKRQPDIWALMGAVADKDEKRALHIYSNLIRRTADVFGVLGLLRWDINRIWVGKELLRRGSSGREISRRLKVRSYYLTEFMEKARSFKEDELYRNYRLLLRADWQIKTGRGNPCGILERLIIALCG